MESVDVLEFNEPRREGIRWEDQDLVTGTPSLSHTTQESATPRSRAPRLHPTRKAQRSRTLRGRCGAPRYKNSAPHLPGKMRGPSIQEQRPAPSWEGAGRCRGEREAVLSRLTSARQHRARRQDDQFVQVTVTPSVKFDVGPVIEESRCQHWKFAVPPATAEYGPEACGMLARLH
ncbi:MAG: hypothetical protein ACJAZN_002526 [Planctomycetota bacterium]|jgi:hypothetical protein